MRQILTVLAFLFALWHAPEAGAAPQDARMKRILVLGDSLSDGFQLKRSEAYPALLVAKLRAAGLAYEVTNVSQSGGTSEEGALNLRSALQKPIDIFLLELGINDVFHGATVDEIQANLQGIIDLVKTTNPNARIIIVGMEFPEFSENDFLVAFQKMFRDLAEKNHAALVPNLFKGVNGHPDLKLLDGIHPNHKGQRIFAKNVWEILEPVAREVSAAR